LKSEMSDARRRRDRVAVLHVALGVPRLTDGSTKQDLESAVMAALTKRIVSFLRTTDHVVPSGSRDFILVLSGIHGQEDAWCVAEGLLRTVRQPVRLSDHDLRVGVNVGIAVSGFQGWMAETLLNKARRLAIEARGRPGNDVHMKGRTVSSRIFSLVTGRGAGDRDPRRRRGDLDYWKGPRSDR
jgi:predicted signal transduction protein with EAL and GGDEF domain